MFNYLVVYNHIDLSETGKSLLLKPPRLRDVHRLTSTHSRYWSELGSALEISLDDREELRTTLGLSNSVRLETVLNMWIRTESVPVTWSKLLEALDEVDGLGEVVTRVNEVLNSEKAFKTYSSLKDWKR